MTVEELYDLLEDLIKKGKGGFEVTIETIDGWTESSYSVDVDDEHESVTIKGA